MKEIKEYEVTVRFSGVGVITVYTKDKETAIKVAEEDVLNSNYFMDIEAEATDINGEELVYN